MGACEVRGSYLSTDAFEGIGVKELERGRYGPPKFSGMNVFQYDRIKAVGDEGYTGGVETIMFSRGGNYPNATKKEQDKILEEALNHLWKRDGLIFNFGLAGYMLVKTKFNEVEVAPFDARSYLRKANSPAVLLIPTAYGSDSMKAVVNGTVAELRKKAHELLRKNNYAKYYYVVGRSKVYCARGDAEFKKKTTRKTNETTMVIPVYKYRYVGMAAE